MAGYKISFKLNVQGNNRILLFKELDKMWKEQKYIPIMFSLNDKQISLSFDNELLKNYDNYLKTILKENKKAYGGKLTKEQKGEVFKQSIKENKQSEKKTDVIAAFDLNPKVMGVCIYNKKTNKFIKRFEIYYASFFDNIKNKGDYEMYLKQKIKLSNKHKHEIKEAINKVFKEFEYYNVSVVFIEDLSMYNVNLNTESNRQINNNWHKNLQYHMIHKNCIRYKIKEMLINPAYTTYIGNMMYNAHDPIAASVGVLMKGQKLHEGSIWNNIPINENTIW